MSRPTPLLRAGLACDDFSGDRALEKGNGAGEKHRVDDVAASGGAVPAGSAGAPRLSAPRPGFGKSPVRGRSSLGDSPNPGLGPHPAPPQHPPGPHREAWPALLLGFEVLFLYDGRNCGQKKKASLLIFLYKRIYECREEGSSARDWCRSGGLGSNSLPPICTVEKKPTLRSWGEKTCL